MLWCISFEIWSFPHLTTNFCTVHGMPGLLFHFNQPNKHHWLMSNSVQKLCPTISCSSNAKLGSACTETGRTFQLCLSTQYHQHHKVTENVDSLIRLTCYFLNANLNAVMHARKTFRNYGRSVSFTGVSSWLILIVHKRTTEPFLEEQKSKAEVYLVHLNNIYH